VSGPDDQAHQANTPPTTEETEMTGTDAAFTAAPTHRPDDVPAGTTLSALVAKHSEAGGRLLNNRLPADFPHQVDRGTADDALTQLALGEAIRRTVRNERCSTMWEALRLVTHTAARVRTLAGEVEAAE
jgi:hypothetical protein